MRCIPPALLSSLNLCLFRRTGFATSPQDLLDHEKFKKYQLLCAQANFLAIDRIDLPFGAKESCRSMSRPTVLDWSTLKRIGRRWAGCPRLVCEYKFQDEQGMLTAHRGAKWASTAADRRSTSGRVLIHGSHIKSWSRTQPLIAPSSAESELYALVKASDEALGFQICDPRPGAFMEHSPVQRRQHTLGCDATPRPGKAKTRGLQFLVRTEPESARGGAVCEDTRE